MPVSGFTVNKELNSTKYGADSRRVAAPSSVRGGRLAPTPSKLHLCRDLPRRSYVHRHRKALCLQREPGHVDVDQLTSFSYCRFVSVFRTFFCIRRKSRTTGSLQPP